MPRRPRFTTRPGRSQILERHPGQRLAKSTPQGTTESSSSSAHSRHAETTRAGSQRFGDFVNEWRIHYAAEHHLTATSLDPMLGVLVRGFGDDTLERLADSPLRIERWLNETGRERNWCNNTWNRYYELLHSLFSRAMKWRIHNVPRVHVNPMASIDKRRGVAARFETRIDEQMEDRLLSVCDLLNRPPHRPHSQVLTWDCVHAIRARAAAGEPQRRLARDYGISTGLCSQVVTGAIWNPTRYRVGTKGHEMRRRLYAAFDLGLRTGEMLAIQLEHVDFTPATVTVDGQRRRVLVITLPPHVTKGGKITGEMERVYAGTARLKRELVKRRQQLGGDPNGYVFGTEAGQQVRGFRRQWRELFQRAGLNVGRHNGMTWHTIRHEFVSRTLENTGDPVVTQTLARHRDNRTTQRYLHARDARILEAAVRLDRD